MPSEVSEKEIKVLQDMGIEKSGVYYTVSFDANGGTAEKTSKMVQADSNYGTLPTATKEGYTFKGWRGSNLLNLAERTERSAGAYGKANPRTFDGKGMYPGMSADNYFSYDTQKKYLIDDISNNVTVDFRGGGYGLAFDIEVETNKKYTFSASKETEMGRIRLGMYDSDGNSVGYNNTVSLVKTINVTGNIRWITIIVARDGANAETMYNLKVEEGENATEYEPYYITSNTKVTKSYDHTLTAVWEENT